MKEVSVIKLVALEITTQEGGKVLAGYQECTKCQMRYSSIFPLDPDEGSFWAFITEKELGSWIKGKQFLIPGEA